MPGPACGIGEGPVAHRGVLFLPRPQESVCLEAGLRMLALDSEASGHEGGITCLGFKPQNQEDY